jgi:RIO-like serine/threonine protein kinase
MKLIRENKEKQRSVFLDGDRYIKAWGNRPTIWINEHVQLLQIHVPGFVLEHGENWISYKVIPGIPASEFPHTPEFVKRIHEFCINQINETRPWFHGDWTLSNMIVDGDTITMVDWDNLGQYSEEEMQTKLNSDLTSAFGELYVF